MEHVYLGRQAIVHNEERLFAYELLYKDKNKENGGVDDRYTSASVISNVLNKFGTQAILGNHRAFVKINYKFLMNDLIFSVPRDFFIFSLLPTINIDEKVLERIKRLSDENYRIGIDDAALTKESL